ncbi:hypothetical protein [Micromonospora inositola]|uniref:Uncharacterized protein n=1 Tax=Micromonospora inositola TaxID=47865 RepID=A0A1C5JZN7_9ACTN|nr:hypothetical protein [Micromonospora inositola]SCG75983.1 hypothetical protein GA0070613_5895 [Micromonospora inositola]
MTPTVSRLVRWAAVIGVGIALTLAAWQDPVLAYAARRPPLGVPLAGIMVATALGGVVGLGLVRAGGRRPLRVSRRPAPSRPLSVSRRPDRRRSRR